jgi:uncharacterized protein YdaU (DUF1376 family)
MKAPWFPFYTGDFLASATVQDMEAHEVGAYVLLLARSWQSDAPGYLEDDEYALRRAARLSVEQWGHSKAALLKKWPVAEHKPGYRYNPRLAAEAEKQVELREKKAEAGRRSAAKREAEATQRQQRANTNPTPVETTATGVAQNGNYSQPQSQPQATNVAASSAGPAAPAAAEVEPSQQPAKSQPKTDKVAAAHPELSFEVFWTEYHNGPGIEKRGSKQTAAARWQGLSESTRRHILAGLPAYRADCTRNGPEYMPYCEKFLNPKKQLWANEGYGRSAPRPALPGPPPPQASAADLWGFNDPPRVQEPRPAYTSSAGQYTGTLPR